METYLNKEALLECKRNELLKNNPEYKDTGYGIEGLLQYYLQNINVHPDSMYLNYNKKTGKYEGESLTARYFQKIYGKAEPSSDTIFNCWSYFKMFAVWRLHEIGVNIASKPKKDVLIHAVLAHYNKIFDITHPALVERLGSLKKLFDELADLHHSLANFMPAPVGFNGSKGRDGKGNLYRDNDMPDIYYKRAMKDFPDKYAWINEHMDEYCLHFFKEYNSPWADREANKPLTNDDLEVFEKTLIDAIECIKKRAESLLIRGGLL